MQKLFASFLITILLTPPMIICEVPAGTAQTSEQHFPVLAIPGQNGNIRAPGNIKKLMGDEKTVVTTVTTPLGRWWDSPDFGQANCVRHFNQATAAQSGPYLVYAESQGTATALELAAAEKPIKALVLEAVLASGNSAIYHTASGRLMPHFNKLARRHNSYYWLPYLARWRYPLYSPFGAQPIKSIAKIPTTLPIIIVHAKGDPQLPYSGACALYYGLRERGNKNVYLISKESDEHTKILHNPHDFRIVQRILKNHGLLQSNLVVGDLTAYQPNHRPFKQQYDLLMHKEQVHATIGSVLKTGGVLGACALLYHKLKKKKPLVV